MRLGDLGEFELIDLIARHQAPAHGRLIKGIGDDCAVIGGEGDTATLVTTDAMVEGVHFDLTTSTPEGIGAKLLAVNVSDIAAMGGRPQEAFLAVSASPDFDATILERLVGGLQASGNRFDVQLAGGDTTSTSGPLVVSLTLVGSCQTDDVVYRSGAMPGDAVYVTGTPGESAAGLRLCTEVWDDPSKKHLLRRHHRPEPRLVEGQHLASRKLATAMLDVSDGLAGDLRHICRQSGVDVVIEPDRLPVSDALRAFCASIGQSTSDFVLLGGEDYELVFTSRKHNLAEEWGLECRLSYIGRVVEGSGEVRILDGENAQPFDKRGFDHFHGHSGYHENPV